MQHFYGMVLTKDSTIHSVFNPIMLELKTSSLDLSKLVVDEITLVGSRCGNYPAGLRALSSGLVQVGEMVDSIYSLDQGLEAITRASQPGVLKVLIRT